MEGRIAGITLVFPSPKMIFTTGKKAKSINASNVQF
ncbi:hypothetical protein P872_10640 [Rhodonellum psychrophilum GCM71 = DSM 17998]|uniref:Uncharacterized protein n=1 Tax=Rhodonellum psychrophilum GCM71 = DSM 17998 TaxID=1123057 RepID=U5BTZ6_9BACT|nr:hypothetical protein P872_10640 [Rhodonellum psychrophilum GCM71 = DSM 17998]